ncbi:MAG TPA: hypothetical protein ENH40_06715 [Nitrospirae bacterium]|nr:hypothetical protein [Nitrospirota bacterium]HDZ62817.1 hypothetical protein [Nitrospirota bacterium]
MNKTTKEHFAIFRKECLKWIEVFGLKGWDVTIKHKKMEDCRAACTSHVVNRWAELKLNIDWNKEWEISKDRLKKDAFHEVMELFLAVISNLAEYRYTTASEIEEEIHAIIRTLENVVFEKK